MNFLQSNFRKKNNSNFFNKASNLPLCKIVNNSIDTSNKCYAEIVFKNGSSYYGEFYNKQRNGLGIYSFFSAVYAGSLKMVNQKEELIIIKR